MSDKTLVPPGTETCECCDGVSASTPVGLFNRAGLSAINYRIGDYGQFKESLHAGAGMGGRGAAGRARQG